jgi:prepilin-type N-terminal cleavage/methylation domain-containing protein/prepilin-type processing-associated H-X9-DG protein
MRFAVTRRCFTLIELLVVVAVIGILIAMIMPVVGRLRERGREVKCRENLRELHIATMNYAYQNVDERLPYSQSWEYYDAGQDRWHAGTGWVDWTGKQQFAVKNESRGFTRWWGTTALTSVSNGTIFAHTGRSLRIYLCPTFAMANVIGTTSPDNANLTFTTMVNPPVRSYAMNSRVSWLPLGSCEASRVLLFADISHTNRYGGATTCERCVVLRNPNSITDCWHWDGELIGTRFGANAYPRESVGVLHNGRGNCVFIDGHTECLPWSETTNICDVSMTRL